MSQRPISTFFAKASPVKAIEEQQRLCDDLNRDGPNPEKKRKLAHENGTLRALPSSQPILHFGQGGASGSSGRVSDVDRRLAQSNAGRQVNRAGKWRYDPVGGGMSAAEKEDEAGSENEQVSLSASQQQRERHEKFLQRLLGTQQSPNETSLPEVDVEEEEEDPAQVQHGNAVEEDREDVNLELEAMRTDLSTLAAPKGKQKTSRKNQQKAGTSEDKYSPLEKQVMALKERHRGILLIIEVGYKFRFFGEDAEIAAKYLNIACFQDRHFKSAMVPAGRLQVHVKRLISQGYKVGIARQTETAALKAVSSTRSQVFVRELTHLYTNATWMPDDAALDDPGQDQTATNYLVCVSEEGDSLLSTDIPRDVREKVHLGLVAVNVQTGECIYDDFEDGFFRSELATRLMHLQPAELLLPINISKATRKALLAASKTAHRENEVMRIETLPDPITRATALTDLNDFYTKSVPSLDRDQSSTDALSTVNRLPTPVQIALAALIKYLKEFKLEHVLDLTNYFRPFQHRDHMLLHSRALKSLEIFEDSNGNNRGLFYVLNHTYTAFGKRLLRNWLGRPLLAMKSLMDRSEAIEDLANNINGAREKLGRLLMNLPDMEKGLIRIAMKRMPPPELVALLNAFRRIAQLSQQNSLLITSKLLKQIAEALPQSRIVDEMLDQIDQPEAVAGNKASMWTDRDMFPDVQDAQDCISMCQYELQTELKRLREELGKPNLSFVTVGGVEYLLEIKKSEAKRIPVDWIRVGSTSTVLRYHTTTILRLVGELARYRETLAAEADKAYNNFLDGIWNRSYEKLREVCVCLATLDCLLSLARLNHQPGYCKPKFVDEQVLQVKDARHPVIMHTSPDPFVPNDIQLDRETIRALVITGPNMGGKSSFVRTVALIVVLAQIGCWVPASEATLGLFDAIHARMGAEDNIFQAQSTFMVEMQECSSILRSATTKSLLLFDEVGRGSSTLDGHAIAHAVLDHAVSSPHAAITLFITHYPLIATTLAHKYPTNLHNGHMGFLETETSDGLKSIIFLYKLVEGLADRSYGLNVALLAGLPDSLLQTAKVKSNEMEQLLTHRHEVIKKRQLQRLVSRLSQGISATDLEDFESFDFSKVA